MSIPGDDAIKRELLCREQMAKIGSASGSQASSWTFLKPSKSRKRVTRRRLAPLE